MDGHYLTQGVDLVELFDTLDGHRTFNVVDALIQDDVLLGQHLDDDGLTKIRAAIRKMRVTKETYAADGEYIPGGLLSGELLQANGPEDDPFGLGMAPMG